MCVGRRACTPRLTACTPRPCCRRVPCKFERIGCPWEGPPHELKEHEKMCTHPSKPAADIMDLLDVTYHRQEDEMRLYKNIFNLLSLEKITFSGEGIFLFSFCSSWRLFFSSSSNSFHRRFVRFFSSSNSSSFHLLVIIPSLQSLLPLLFF